MLVFVSYFAFSFYVYFHFKFVAKSSNPGHLLAAVGRLLRTFASCPCRWSRPARTASRTHGRSVQDPAKAKNKTTTCKTHPELMCTHKLDKQTREINTHPLLIHTQHDTDR